MCFVWRSLRSYSHLLVNNREWFVSLYETNKQTWSGGGTRRGGRWGIRKYLKENFSPAVCFFLCIFMLYFGSKRAPQARILYFDTKKISEGDLLRGGTLWAGGIRKQLFLKIEIFLGGGGIGGMHPLLIYKGAVITMRGGCRKITGS